MNVKAFICLFTFALFGLASGEKKMRYFIPHSHDDLGWVKTIDEYYNDSVRSIFDTVLTALEENPENMPYSKKRKFIYSEVGFLKKYLEEDPSKSEEKKERIRKLIKTKQWEFINGGMSQSDSACPHYEDIAENYFYGLSYLGRNFKESSKAGWQIDPFGHSTTLIYLARLLGMNHTVLNRIGDETKEQMGRDQELEFTMNFPDGNSSTIHVTTFMYIAPPGIDCDIGCTEADFNKQKLDSFLSDFDQKYKYSPWYPLGHDFSYSDAVTKFKFLDYALDQYDDLQFSLFSNYLADFNSKSKDLKNKDSDFFVYKEGNGDTWSGYFTTKPRLKYKIRRLGKLLRSLRSLFFVVLNHKGKFEYVSDLLDISEDFGIFLHHDAITGTAKRYVDEDYFARMEVLEKRMAAYFSMADGEVMTCDYNDMETGKSACVLSELVNNKEMYVNLFNPSHINRTEELVELVIPKSDYQVVLRKEGDSSEGIEFDSVSNGVYTSLYFKADFAAFSLSRYSLTLVNKQDKAENSEKHVKSTNKGKSLLESSFELSDWNVQVNSDEILLTSKSIDSLVNKLSFSYLNSDKSGAYILKYTNPQFKPYNKFVTCNVVKGKYTDILVIEGDRVNVRLIFAHNTQDTYEVRSYIHNDDLFKEGVDVILNIENPALNTSKFMTDSNGLFEMTRTVQNTLESSVFPVTTYIKVEDEQTGGNLTVFVDRAEGGTSLSKGRVSLYIQRSTCADDNKGVGEFVEVHEDIITRHTVLNSTKDQHSGRFIDISNQIDVPLTHLWSKVKTQRNLSQPSLYENSTNQLRLNVDLIDESSFFVRIQNLNRYSPYDSAQTYRDFIKSIYGDYDIVQVGFDYLFDHSGTRKIISNGDENLFLKPLEFKTFLLKQKEKNIL